MGRIVWINGAFSSGKTTVAGLLLQQFSDAFLLDPAVIGTTLRDHLVPSPLLPTDFQDIPLWRQFTRDAVGYAAAAYSGTVVVPMTVARIDYFEEIIGALRQRASVAHFTLVASKATTLAREAARPDDTGGWARKTADEVIGALADPRFAEHIDAESQTPAQIVKQIVEQIGRQENRT